MSPRRRKQRSGRSFFTTHQVASFFGVTIPTVAGWCDDGILEYHRTPGGHRRIARETLSAFARQRGVSLPREVMGGQPRILIVDDERDFSEMVRDYLGIKGFEVEVAHTAFQAGLQIGRFQPELVLLDIQMPDADGFEVVRLLHEDASTRNVRVLACTAYRDPELDARVARESFDGLVEKPVNMGHLHGLVRDALGLDDEEG